jgi:histidinol-phosphate aminotransferase
MKALQELVRPNIWSLQPYSSARDEYQGVEAKVFLDANESPYNSPKNRYPDPLQWEVKEALAPVKKVKPENIFLGNGSDEAIDLVFRVFCEPKVDNVVAITPTYGMYQVCAEINNVEYRTVTLNDAFQIEAERLLAATDEHTKVIFLCTPNNPTGNLLDPKEVDKILTEFEGIVVIDEAYSEFSGQPCFRQQLAKYPNAIVLNTFSKAWASAGIRLGMAFASKEIIGLFNKVKYPYNVNFFTQSEAIRILDRQADVSKWVALIIGERGRMMEAFSELPICERVYPTDANFFLARMTDANAIYRYLVSKGVIVRNRSKVTLCDNCLRITIGTAQENATLLSALRFYKPEQ